METTMYKKYASQRSGRNGRGPVCFWVSVRSIGRDGYVPVCLSKFQCGIAYTFVVSFPAIHINQMCMMWTKLYCMCKVYCICLCRVYLCTTIEHNVRTDMIVRKEWRESGRNRANKCAKKPRQYETSVQACTKSIIVFCHNMKIVFFFLHLLMIK